MPSNTQVARSARRAADQAIFEHFKPLIKSLAALLGPGCEVVLHNLSDPRNLEHTIIALEGNVTGRTVGGPPTGYLLGVIRSQEDLSESPDYVIYPGRTADGRPLKSCTTFIRNPAGLVIGALCINIDMSEWEQVRGLVERFCKVEADPRKDPPAENFANDIQGTITTILRDSLRTFGKPTTELTKEERIVIVEQLERRGVFMVRGVVGQIARLLGVSRYTLYNYLDAVRAQSRDSLHGQLSDAVALMEEI